MSVREVIVCRSGDQLVGLFKKMQETKKFPIITNHSSSYVIGNNMTRRNTIEVVFDLFQFTCIVDQQLNQEDLDKSILLQYFNHQPNFIKHHIYTTIIRQMYILFNHGMSPTRVPLYGYNKLSTMRNADKAFTDLINIS